MQEIQVSKHAAKSISVMNESQKLLSNGYLRLLMGPQRSQMTPKGLRKS